MQCITCVFRKTSKLTAKQGRCQFEYCEKGYKYAQLKGFLSYINVDTNDNPMLPGMWAYRTTENKENQQQQKEMAFIKHCRPFLHFRQEIGWRCATQHSPNWHARNLTKGNINDRLDGQPYRVSTSHSARHSPSLAGLVNLPQNMILNTLMSRTAKKRVWPWFSAATP